jgi:PAS domain S-box-containing protein
MDVRSVTSPNFKFRQPVFLSLILSVLIPFIISVYSIYFLKEWKWVNVSVLSTVEALGSFAALSTASLILIMLRNNKLPRYYIWVSGALMSIGTLDLLRAVFSSGDLFIWLGRMTVLTGGVLFILVWLPDRFFFAESRSTPHKLLVAVFIFSISLGVFSIVFPSIRPPMEANGSFTDTANIIHVLGGVMYLIAGAYFIIRYRSSRQNNDLLFFNFAMLNGWADLIFPFSELWCACWWFIHLLRLAAYLVVVTYVFSVFQSQEKEWRRVNEDLKAEISERKRVEAQLLEQATLLDKSQDAIAVRNLENQIIYWNKGAERLYGWTAENVMGRNADDLLYREDLSELLEAKKSALEKGEWIGELRQVTKDGREIIVESRWTLIHDNLGKAKSTLVINTDVTERKRVEEEASQLLKELNTIFDNIPVGITYLDTEYRALKANKHLYNIIGLSEAQYIGKPCYETVGEYAEDPTRKGREKICGFCKIEESFKTKKPVVIERAHGDSIIRVTTVPKLEQDGTISHFVELAEDITKRKQAEEKLKQSEEKYRTLIGNIQDGVFITDGPNIQFANEALARMIGYTVEEIIGKDFRELTAPEDADMVAGRYSRRQIGEDVPKDYEYHMLHKDGKTRILVNVNVGLVPYQGKVASIGTLKDITEKRKLQDQLLRAQRMESLGTLSEGIAHDMNNVLSPIMLSLHMLKERFTDSESQELLDILESGAQRGAGLVKQVRSFTSGVESERKAIQIEPIIEEISQIAKETFPRNMEIKTSIADNLWATSGDATQLHQVLMNLCVNSRDAMPDGGILSISAENVTVDENYSRMNSMHQNTEQQTTSVLNCWEYEKCGREPGGVKVAKIGVCPAAIDAQVDGLNRGSKGGRICWAVTGTFCGGQVQGTFAKKQLSCMNCEFYQKVKVEEGDQFIETKVGQYIVTTISDTGVGIPPEIIDRIFDPFFTTKQLGKGTGLGLSTALGIVKSHGGVINVYSEVGKGTAFKVYLPAVQIAEAQKMEEQPELPTGGGALILVVDDEAMICKITDSILKTNGYRVLTAHDGSEAIKLYEQNKEKVKVVIMDMMLPGMDGATCINILRKINPDVKVIAVSGLAENSDLAKEGTSAVQAFLPKPYTSDILLRTVYEVIRGK